MAAQQNFRNEEIIRSFALVGETLARLALNRLDTEPLTIESTPQTAVGLLTRQEAAKYLHVSLTKLSEEVRLKNIRAVKSGRSVRFRREELDRWAKCNQR